MTKNLPDSIAPGTVRLRFYIASPTPTSIRALANLRAILADFGPAAAAITVQTVDVTAEPLQALKDRVIVTPSLILCGQDMVPALVGDLSDTDMVRAFLHRAVAAVR